MHWRLEQMMSNRQWLCGNKYWSINELLLSNDLSIDRLVRSCCCLYQSRIGLSSYLIYFCLLSWLVIIVCIDIPIPILIQKSWLWVCERQRFNSISILCRIYCNPHETLLCLLIMLPTINCRFYISVCNDFLLNVHYASYASMLALFFLFHRLLLWMFRTFLDSYDYCGEHIMALKKDVEKKVWNSYLISFFFTISVV